MKIFAQRLKQSREYEGYTQEQFSKMLQVPLSTYRKYELQSPKWHSEPSQESLVKIAKLIHSTLRWIPRRLLDGSE